jgi:hypothetical protein
LARHILLRNRPGLTDQDAERRLAGYRDQVRAKTADFAELAKNIQRMDLHLTVETWVGWVQEI